MVVHCGGWLVNKLGQMRAQRINFVLARSIPTFKQPFNKPNQLSKDIWIDDLLHIPHSCPWA